MKSKLTVNLFPEFLFNMFYRTHVFPVSFGNGTED